MAIWGKLKAELDRAGAAAQHALDEGKVRLELHRTRQAMDRAAQEFGLAMYRALKEQRDLTGEQIADHMRRIGEQETEVRRLEEQLAAAGARRTGDTR
jgi:uncharacterized protein involved in exopolysaccharide biosynthesis